MFNEIPGKNCAYIVNYMAVS